MTYIYTRTPTRLHYPARLRARVIIIVAINLTKSIGACDHFNILVYQAIKSFTIAILTPCVFFICFESTTHYVGMTVVKILF